MSDADREKLIESFPIDRVYAPLSIILSSINGGHQDDHANPPPTIAIGRPLEGGDEDGCRENPVSRQSRKFRFRAK